MHTPEGAHSGVMWDSTFCRGAGSRLPTKKPPSRPAIAHVREPDEFYPTRRLWASRSRSSSSLRPRTASQKREKAHHRSSPRSIAETTLGSERSSPTRRFSSRRSGSHAGHSRKVWSAVSDAAGQNQQFAVSSLPMQRKAAKQPWPVITCATRKLTKMKFRWTPPFFARTGKIKLEGKYKNSNLPSGKTSYKVMAYDVDSPAIQPNPPVPRLPKPEVVEERHIESQKPEVASPKEEDVKLDVEDVKPDEGSTLKPPERSTNKKKQGISGHSSGLTHTENSTDIQLPKYEKDEEDEELIRRAIRGNEFLKEGLFACKDVVQAVVEGMYPKTVPANTHVIREGEVGFHMYVCAEGTIEVFKQSKKVNTLGPGMLFGELALLYNSKRNATILATTPCKFWVLDREVFMQIMKKSGMQMMENRVKFLRSVPLLSKLETEHLIKMTDILKLRSYPGGEVIIRQGDEGSLFFILTGGSVSVTITQEDGSVRHGSVLKAGDFFGEMALLKNVKRAATVTALDPGVECLTLDRVHFIEYLGGFDGLENRHEIKTVPSEQPEKSEYDHVQLSDLERIGTLGIGGFGRVELVHLKEDKNLTFALKCAKKVDVVNMGQQEHMFNEKENMMLCRSPFIIRMYNTYKSSKYLYFLMEVCLGGDVFGLLEKRRFFDEPLARFTTACMVEAFDYLHARGIAYRDLKPENVLYDSKGYAKLGDFGFSKKLGPSSKTWTFAGTPEYLAPEIILNEGHDKAADYWTLGIFIHELLVGKPPFRGHDHSSTFTLILKGIDSVKFPRHMHKSAQMLVRKLCRRVPAERLGYQREGISGIKTHKWFQNFDWKALQKTTLKAPYIPKLSGMTDLSNFDKYARDKEIPPDEFGDWDANF